MTVNKENVRAWVDALRSGKYKQTKALLAVIEEDGSESFCCLGVACELAGLERQKGLRTRGGDGVIAYGYAAEEEYQLLPRRAQEWLGIEWQNPSVYYGDRNLNITELNDERGMTFDQIADVIEANYLTEAVPA